MSWGSWDKRDALKRAPTEEFSRFAEICQSPAIEVLKIYRALDWVTCVIDLSETFHGTTQMKKGNKHLQPTRAARLQPNQQTNALMYIEQRYTYCKIQ